VESATVDENELNYVCDLIDGRQSGGSGDDEQAGNKSGSLDDDQEEADDEDVEQALAD
jgi:hypothetical protein